MAEIKALWQQMQYLKKRKMQLRGRKIRELRSLRRYVDQNKAQFECNCSVGNCSVDEAKCSDQKVRVELDLFYVNSEEKYQEQFAHLMEELEDELILARAQFLRKIRERMDASKAIAPAGLGWEEDFYTSIMEG